MTGILDSSARCPHANRIPASFADLPALAVDSLGWIDRTDRSNNVRVAILSGPAGSGKTWTAQTALQALAEQNMIAGWGKYGEGRSESAFGPIVAALNAILGNALAKLYDPQTGIASLTEHMGVDLDVLIAAGLDPPGMRSADEIVALSDRRSSAARLRAAALRLLAWLDRFEQPCILLIDDWDRAPAEAAQLIRAIASAPAATPLLLFLTQRRPEVDRMIGDGVPPIIYRFGPLDDRAVLALLSDRLGDGDRAALVMAWLDRSVPRLPFDILQVADALMESGAFRRRGRRWQLDDAKVASLALDANARIGTLNASVLGVALAVALWGEVVPRAMCEQAVAGAAIDLPHLAARGIVELDADHVRFRHDRLRQAVLDISPGDTLRRCAGDLSERLRSADAGDDINRASLHLRLQGGLDEIDAAAWRDRFADGAVAARGRGDLVAATRFAEAAVALERRAPARDHDAIRTIRHEALLAAADRDDPATEARARALLETAQNPADRYADYETGAIALRFADRNDAAWDFACEGLREAGIAPPSRAPAVRLLWSAVRWRLARRRDRRARAANDADPTSDFAGLAAAAAHIAYHRDPRGTAIIGFQASLRAGDAVHASAYWQSVHAFLFAAMGERRRAAESGANAVALIDAQTGNRAATLYQAIFFGTHWREPLKSQRHYYPEIVRIAQGEGDLVIAAYAWRIYIMSGWRAGEPLDALLDQAVVARRALRDLGEDSFVAEMEAMVAMLEGLTGRAPWTPDLWRDDIPTRNHVIDLELANLVGDWPETLRRAKALRPLRRDYDIQSDSVALRFHETLARVRCGRDARRDDLAFIRTAATLNPADHRAKLLLIEAERARLQRRPDAEIRDAYAVAVHAASHSDSRLDAGLAAACAADALRQIGRGDLAAIARRKADGVWREWGVAIETFATLSAAEATPAAMADAQARVIAAERSDAAKSRLLAHVAHELRTPLQALQTLLDLSAQGGRSIDIGEVRPVLASLKNVVDDLNILGGLGGDRTGGIVHDVDVAALVRSEIALTGQERIALHIDMALPRFDLAADRLRQVIRNLLSNAVKYGGDGPIDVRVTSGAPATDGGIDITFDVADRGPGIPPDDLETVFEPFHRGDFAGDGRGTGLGLALSRQIAARLGGTLVARNRQHGGARFTLRFEALPSSRAQVTIPVARPASILLVEDAPLVRRLLVTMLERAGHRVVEAGDAAHAIAAWRNGGFDLAITDIGLPDASGLAALAAIRETDPTAPVILLTASMTGEAEDAASADTRVRALRKPASAQALNATVAELVGAAPAIDLIVAPDDLDPLYQAARAEIVEQARSTLAAPHAATPAGLHRLAGLAAQFGWMPMAVAVEDLGAALAAGTPQSAMPGLAAALAAMVDA